jgi:hypothetical protein
MLRKQILVGAGILVAVAVLLVFANGHFTPAVTLPLDDTAERLAFAAKWLLVPGFALLAGIGLAGGRRFFTPDAIDGSRTPQSPSLEINLRYNQNTLEQTSLVLIAWPLLALWLPADRLALLPLLAVLFGIGRAAFWIGYLIAPWARAFGFALTFYPTVAVYIWLALHAWR